MIPMFSIATQAKGLQLQAFTGMYQKAEQSIFGIRRDRTTVEGV